MIMVESFYSTFSTLGEQSRASVRDVNGKEIPFLSFTLLPFKVHPSASDQRTNKCHLLHGQGAFSEEFSAIPMENLFLYPQLTCWKIMLQICEAEKNP